MSQADIDEQNARKAVHFAAAGGITDSQLATVNAAAAAAQSTADAIKAGAATDADTLLEVAGKITSAITTLKGSADVSGDTLGELEALAATAQAAADAIKAGTSSSNDTLIEVFNAIASQITTATTGLVGTATAAGDTLGELETRIASLETPRIQTVTSAATVTPNADANDEVVITAQAAALAIAAPSGTPKQGQPLLIRIKDDGTARAITWDAIYRAIGVTLPTTTVISKAMYVGCVYNSTVTKWDVLGVNQEA